MRKRSAYAVNSMVLVALTLLSCVVSLSADAKPKFASFDFPGAINTQATGITPSGDIVGRYTSPDGVQHGFLLRVGRFVPLIFQAPPRLMSPGSIRGVRSSETISPAMASSMGFS